MIRKGLEWFGGSVLVYVLVAACSGTDIGDKLMGDGDGDAMVMGGGDQMGDGDGKPGTSSGGKGAGTGTGAAASGDGDGDTGGMMGMITDPVPDADAAEDGERIVNLYRTTPDGLKTAEGYWDKELNVQCNFSPAEDGKQRCLPISGASVGTFFADSECSAPTALVAKGSCPHSEYAQQVKYSPECSGVTTTYAYIMFKIGSKRAAGIYSGSPEACTAVSAFYYDTYDFYSVAQVPASAFAEGTLTHE